ncbi:MAG: PKD domain-containing protein [Verrucomicrobiaceae bacterium]|nr:PKD domain-containing protein [Verrucomicrobiaceae bacterium]
MAPAPTNLVPEVAGSAVPADGEVIARFRDWTAAFLAADAAEKAALESQGRELAAARRPVFKQWIKEDPRAALANAVPMVVRQQLPLSVLSLLEERVNGRAALRVYQGLPAEGEPLPTKAITQRVAEFSSGKTYDAHVYGRREETVTWLPNASLNGVAIDTDFAVSEDPIRVLEIGEIPDASKVTKTLCPVSGNETAGAALEEGEAVDEETPAVEAYGEITYLCNGDHATIYREIVLQAEGGTGGPTQFTGILPAAPTPSLGVVKVLYMPVTYADQNGVPATESKCYEVMRDVGDFYSKASFGRLTLLTTVTPPIKLPHNEAWYIQRDTSNGGDIDGEGMSHSHARNEARRLGFDSNDYDCVVMRHKGGPGSYGGLGGGSSVWVRSDSVGIVAHEVGHCFGLAHANYWDTAGTSSIGAGTNAEYGDTYDNMGNGPTPAGQYNAQAKSQIKWLPPEYREEVTQSGLYRIYAFDQARLNPARRYAMTLVKDAQRTYWGEVRSLFTSNNWASNGMILGWRFPSGSGSNVQLIDTTPGSPFGKEDAPISLGSTFSDTEAGIHLTTVAASKDPWYVDVQVNMGDFAGNHAPTLALDASAEVVPQNATVTFTATANDEDGDTLAYSWQHFGDSAYKVVDGNAPVMTRKFTANGSYVVTCTVSDMKGGSATRSKLIIVGNGNSRFVISGRITEQGIGLADVIVTANGANGVVTDSDGYYTIPNLAANTYTMTPLRYGYSFGEIFNNSVTVGPSFSGADFVADEAPRVNIVASAPNAAESSTNGQFTITRTGDLSQALVVNVNAAQGTGTLNSDYALSPAYTTGTQGFQLLTIPADVASLDVVVTPMQDTAAEGPETVVLQLGPASGYVVGTPSNATVTIADDDTVLPKVGVRALVASTTEGALEGLVFSFSRTGVTSSPLTLNYTIGGTAGNGVDYATLSGAATIPAGQENVSIEVVSANDSISESVETVKLTLAAHAAWIVDSTASTVTGNVVDDDVQVVTVTASDPDATEIDLSAPGAHADTGTFVITREGDLSSPLKVFYAIAGTPSAGVPALHGVDFEPLPGVLEIPAGVASGSVTIVPRFDGLGEGSEIVVLQLGSGSTQYRLGDQTNATVTIADNASDLPYVEVIPLRSCIEGTTNGILRLSARGGGTGTLTVNYTIGGTATAGSDYNITGLNNATLQGSTTITLNNGATVTKDLTVTVTNDALAEDLETIEMTLLPGVGYQTYTPTSSASMWLRDDDQPTVFVDTQVGTSGTADTIVEGSATATRFYLSRTGSTAAALTVNYTLAGTATSGADFTGPTGSVIIPAGQLGVLLPLTITDDSDVEGTETVVLTLAAGGYAKGPAATLYISDNETVPQKVAFNSVASAGAESATVVNIPVSLTTPAAVPTTVEFALDSGTRTTSTANGTLALPYWVRVTRSGTSFDFYASSDGVAWEKKRSTTLSNSISTSSYLAGIAVGNSASGTGTTATVDNVTITDLAGGGAAGALVSANIGTPNPAGSDSESGGVYTVIGGGAGISTNSTTDNFRYLYFPITNSTTCTLTARIVGMTGGANTARAGVMIRDTTANNSRHSSMMAETSGTWRYIYRTSTNGNAATSSGSVIMKPYWVRLQRISGTIRAFRSSDGNTWVQNGADQPMALASSVLAGLAVSSRANNSLALGTFDNVTIDPPLPAGIAMEGRTVGFATDQGTGSFDSGSGTWSVEGGGLGINVSNQDRCHFVAAPVTGDFTLTARVSGLSGGAAAAQAGVMIRETSSYRSRMAFIGLIANASTSFFWRNTAVTNSYGSGVDHDLSNGILTFGIGEQTKNITFNVVDDEVTEPNETVTLTLKNPNAAALGTITQHTYVIEDDDAGPASSYVGFAATTSAVSESAGGALLQVSLDAAAETVTSVDYAVTGGTAGGADFTLASGTITFNVGDTVNEIPLTIADDWDVEADETVVVTLSSPVGAALGSIAEHTFTILDDDKPIVTVDATDPAANEAGDTGTMTFSRTGSTTAPMTVNFTVSGSAASGSDYASIGTSVVIPAGSTFATITIVPVQNTANEAAETVIVTLASDVAYAIGVSANATVTITDDDRSTVTIVASDPEASESAGNPGQFTVTRTAPTTGSLTVNLIRTGTATNTTDYTGVGTSVSIAAGQTSAVINVNPVDDSVTEGPELVTLGLNSGSYDIGGDGFANVTIEDNDSPPAIFIESPTAQGPLIASSNGVIVRAVVTDDGAPQPFTVQWTQADGPGTATFESPTTATSAVTFSAPGTYTLRITATDTQFTVSDQVIVVVGSELVAADWITQDMTPISARRGQGLEFGGLFTVTGTGVGYTGTNDGAHIMVRQVAGDASIVARLTDLPVSTALSGLTMRDSLARSARRAVLGFVPNSGLQLRARTTGSTTDTLVASAAGLSLPLWLKLERNASTEAVTASYAADNAGAPGAWTQLGVPTTITMGSDAQVGLTTTNNSTSGLATALFDNLTLTPAPSGPALVSEDAGAVPNQAGSGSESGGTYTIAGSTTGYYHGRQYYGDMVVTARMPSFTSGAGSARGGIRIAESMEAGAYAHVGRIPTGSYSGYIWTSIAGGAGGGVPSGIAAGNWIRVVRKGNSITGFRAVDASGSPGAWTQIGQSQTVIMNTPVFVGFWVDNASGVGLNTCTFTNLSVQPLNKAPIVGIASTASWPISPMALNGSVADDNFPTPVVLTSQWTQRSGPAPIVFGNPALAATTATLSQAGDYVLRLTADDGGAQSFKDLAFTGYTTPYEVWQGQNFALTGGVNDPEAAFLLDPDLDGQVNLLEYAFGMSPSAADSLPIEFDQATVGLDRFLRMTVPKNSAATDVTFIPEATSDLTNPASWSSDGLIIETDSSTQLIVRDNVPMTGGQRRFMRVRVLR